MLTLHRPNLVPMKGDLFSPGRPAITAPMLELPINQLHRDGQDTSRRALKKTVKSRANAALATLHLLRTYGREGTIPEVMAATFGTDLIDVRRHFSALKKKKLIEPTGVEIKNAKQNACMAWRAK